MGLIDLWRTSRDQLKGKHVQQIIAFAGTGQLSDGSNTSSEFREFLRHIPSDILEEYANQCLQDSFNGSGFALQDIVNEVGRRLGFDVVPGRYRGTAGEVGFDGVWQFPNGHAAVIEVKTSDAYRIELDKIAGYRRELVRRGKINEAASSILIIVGNRATQDLEAQIRGSRYAWDMRLLSVEALLRLMHLKETIEDPQIVQKIHSILIPREFTRLDEIVDLVFSTTEEVKEQGPQDEEGSGEESKPSSMPKAFHEACVARVEKHLDVTLLRQSRTGYISPDDTVAITCAVSKEYKSGGRTSYWFAFHPYQKEFLEKAIKAYVVLGCGSEETVLLFPFDEFAKWLHKFWTTEKNGRFYWHVRIHTEGGKILLDRRGKKGRLDVTHYLLTSPEQTRGAV